MKDVKDDPMFVSVEVKRIREFIDCEADNMGRDVLRRTLHQMLDRVCKADDEQYNSYRQHLEKQGGVMAETARQNVRLHELVRNLLTIARNRMPSAPTIGEIEVMSSAEKEVK